MKENKMTSFIIVAGVFIFIVFSFVSVYNIIPNSKESSSYYAKVKEEMNAKIDNVEVNDNNLTINTSGDAIEYCVKLTETTPKDKSLCWKEIENNKATTSIYSGKKYYVWIKDSNKNISIPVEITPDNK